MVAGESFDRRVSELALEIPELAGEVDDVHRVLGSEHVEYFLASVLRKVCDRLYVACHVGDDLACGKVTKILDFIVLALSQGDEMSRDAIMIDFFNQLRLDDPRARTWFAALPMDARLAGLGGEDFSLD
jgi:hypothetical protein